MQRQKKVRLRNLKTSRDGREKIKIKFKKASITTKKSIEKILKSTKEREGRVFMIWLRENPLLQMWDESSLNKKFVFSKKFHIFV